MMKLAFSTILVSLIVGTTAMAAGQIELIGPNEKFASSSTEYRYTTLESVILQGVVAMGDVDVESDSIQAVPTAIKIPANTSFEVADRIIDTENNRFVKVNIETGDDEDSVVSYWVLESDFVQAMYKDAAGKELELGAINQLDAKFYYSGSFKTAGGITFIMPVRGARRTSPPGFRRHPILKYRKFHAGWDLAAPTGTPVYAAATGIVTLATRQRGYGNIIMIQHGVLQTRYAHLSKILVRKNQRVVQGQIIGKVGSTGMSTGPHLHYEKRGPGGRVLTGPITSSR